jgi:hypothetical protein
MASITYGTAPRSDVSARAPAKKKGFWSRLWRALIAAQMRKAQCEIELHRHLLPADYEIAGNKLSYRSEDQLPFVR